MNYKFSDKVRENDGLRASFNELTRKTFYFDFTEWYDKGFWTDNYIPHVLLDGDKVIANISVNRMNFSYNGVTRQYIQLGTVMTDKDYRGQGLSRYLMELILHKYSNEVEDVYLFANDSVLEFYPRFGFKKLTEYEYYIAFSKDVSVKGTYSLEHIDMKEKEQWDKVITAVQENEKAVRDTDANDAFALRDNIGLYQFWLMSEHIDDVYYIPEKEAYIIARVEEGALNVISVISAMKVDMMAVAAAFDRTDIKEIRFSHTPVNRKGFDCRVHKIEDCTLFALNDKLRMLETGKMMIPEISHA